jgi:hypothetical protein
VSASFTSSSWQPTPAAMAMLDRPLIAEEEDDLHEVTLIRQPKTAKAGQALYGSSYDRQRCLRAITTAIGFWQCGHPNGKGTRGLYCGRHA